MLHLTRSDGSKFYLKKELIESKKAEGEDRTRIQLKNSWHVYVTESLEEIERQEEEGCTYE